MTLGISPVGVAVSPDGRLLYATSQGAGPAGPGPQPTYAPDEGTLAVLDVAKAESDPPTAGLSTVRAGCNPVRVIVSADGTTLWVTARATNGVLAFSAARARRDAQHALLARLPVGQAPVGMVLFRHGTRLLVANQNRFSAPGAAPDLSVVDTSAALKGDRRCWVPSPLNFPREFAVGPGEQDDARHQLRVG